jgi:DNA invertase Pin-like site-specific DNA recombinase
MSTTNGNGLRLEGTGAAYVRVSTDPQDTERQYNALHAFEGRHGVTIPEQHWYEDEGWARDADKTRPAFQQLLARVKLGEVKWIVVESLDRFGTRSAKRLMGYLADLEDAGCRLFDSSDKEWTGEDDGTEISAWVAGKTSTREQRQKSHNILGGKAGWAELGEWQGGHVRLGLDVACYSKETGKELWRVVWGKKHERDKVYPDGRREQFNGKGNFPKWQEVTEFLRVAPSRDKDKVDAVVRVFTRFATEAISFGGLARFLNGLGYCNGCGGEFSGRDVQGMLSDEAYMGFATFNKKRRGRFNRYAGQQVVHELNYDGKLTANDEADWIRKRLFKPLIDPKTWGVVKAKLERLPKRSRAARSPKHYLAGLVFCAKCGAKMYPSPPKKSKTGRRKDGRTAEPSEYYCSTYHARVHKGTPSKCRRNSVDQDELAVYIDRYLEEAGKRLEVLTGAPAVDPPTARKEREEEDAWGAYRDGLARLTAYLAEFHPEEYNAILREDARLADEEDDLLRNGQPAPPDALRAFLNDPELDAEVRAHANDPLRRYTQAPREEAFVDAALYCYRTHFDPAAVEAEIKRLDAEHTRQMGLWAEPPTPLAKEKAKARLADLEARIGELRAQQQDAAGAVTEALRAVHDLQDAIHAARQAMRGEAGERALRERAEKLRGVIHRIECKFVATDRRRGGWGKKSTRLVSVTFVPYDGEAKEYPVERREKTSGAGAVKAAPV